MAGIKVERPDAEKLHKMNVKTWPIWEKEISKFDWYYDSKEICYILEGEVEVHCSGGDVVKFQAGDLVTFSKGLNCVWDIKKAVRKHYNFED